MSKFRRVLINLIHKTIPAAIPGKVKSVNEEDFTCVVTPFDDGANYEEVRLKANVDGFDDGMVSIPEVGSSVLISPLFNSDRAYYVSRFSKVKKWHLKTVSGSSLAFDDQGNVSINGGTLGGIAKIDTLVSKLNAIETDLNTLKTAFATWVIVPADGGAALKAITAAWYAQTLSPSTKVQLENTKVKHG